MAYKKIELTNAGSLVQQSTKQSQFYKGFSSVGNNPGNRLYDFDLVKQDIINHFNTRKGTRVMNPAFGTIIWDLIMEPLTAQTRQALQEDVSRIVNFDSRVTPTQINLTEYPDGYVIDLTLLMNGTDQSVNMKLSFDQKLGLRAQ